MSKFNLFDYFFVLRPLILIPTWNFLLIGAYLSLKKPGFTYDIIIGFVTYTCIMGGIYILNQIMDIETDRINKKLFLLSGGYIPTRWAYIEIILLWVLAIILSLTFGSTFLFFIILSLVLGILYSVPPVKLKGKPFADTLVNGVGYGLVNFSIGWLLVARFEWTMFIAFLPYILSISGVFINTTIVDIEGDRKAHEITTAVFLGENLSYIVSTILMISAIVTAVILKDLICLLPAAISLPLFVYAAVYSLTKHTIHRKVTIASFRLPGLIFTLITGLLYPPYLVILLIILVSMRLYYKTRFGMIYPTLANG
jgi:4-hydroxybenzoate polyprenyltransferase